MMVRMGLALAAVLMSMTATPVPAQTGKTPPDDLCQPPPPTLSRMIEISDRVIMAKVTRVTRDTAPTPRAGEPRLERGVFELTPVSALKGDLPDRPLVQRFDATLYPDLFGGTPCRYSPQPVEGDVWLIVASRDGEDCGGCGGRLDATHKLYYLLPADQVAP